jgi:hypothetical protein
VHFNCSAELPENYKIIATHGRIQTQIASSFHTNGWKYGAIYACSLGISESVKLNQAYCLSRKLAYAFTHTQIFGARGVHQFVDYLVEFVVRDVAPFFEVNGFA